MVNPALILFEAFLAKLNKPLFSAKVNRLTYTQFPYLKTFSIHLYFRHTVLFYIIVTWSASMQVTHFLSDN
jgi:hypothetical protein